MLTFLKNIADYSSEIFTNFINFIIQNNLLSLFIVGVIGIALSQLISSIKTNIFDYYLNKIFKTSNNNLINLITSFLQFLIIIIFLFFIFKNIIKPINDRFQQYKFDEIGWKNNLLNEIKDIKSQL